MQARGFEFLLSAINPNNPNVPGFVNKYGVPFPVGTSDYQKARDFMQFSVVQNAYVPWLVFIDRTGTIRAQFTGNDTFFNNVEASTKEWAEKLLAERAPARRRRATKK
ncbi:MAG: hypothetical protein R2762_09020 [Bryobacteraceae bacterium]